VWFQSILGTRLFKGWMNLGVKRRHIRIGRRIIDSDRREVCNIGWILPICSVLMLDEGGMQTRSREVWLKRCNLPISKRGSNGTGESGAIVDAAVITVVTGNRSSQEPGHHGVVVVDAFKRCKRLRQRWVALSCDELCWPV